MFPLRDDNPAVDTSVATFAIIGLNLAAWGLLQGFGTDPALTTSVCTLGVIPGELLGTVPAGTQVPMGPGAACVLSPEPNWLTPLSSMFMHGGWFHILGNLWFLYIFGDNVEDSMGALRFVVVLRAVRVRRGGRPDLLESRESDSRWSGASGAIGGVMGAYALLYPKAPVHMMLVFGFFLHRTVVPAWMMLGYWMMLQLARRRDGYGWRRGHRVLGPRGRLRRRARAWFRCSGSSAGWSAIATTWSGHGSTALGVRSRSPRRTWRRKRWSRSA